MSDAVREAIRRLHAVASCYALLVHRTVYLVCLLLAFGLIAAAGSAMPVLTALIADTFFGLDRLSQEIDEPFGTEANDLALYSLCRIFPSAIRRRGLWSRAAITCRNKAFKRGSIIPIGRHRS